MPAALGLFVHHAYLIVFLWVLAEQFGLPIPSVPVFLAAGSLAVTDRRLILVPFVAVAACLISDSVWYRLGSRFGGPVLKLLCHVSFEVSTCVRRTEESFARYGAAVLVIAKFVPGLSTAAPPIAGQIRMGYRTFLVYDLAGSFIWSGVFTLAGAVFGNVLRLHPQALSHAERYLGLILFLAVLGYIIYRILRWRAFLRRIRTARIEPEDLKQMMDAGKPVFIVDLRHSLDPDPRTLPGALRISPDELVGHAGEIPRDTDIVLYCSCPSEATSAKTAMRLRDLGITRVRPLREGFDGWKKRRFPLATPRKESVGA